MELLLCGGQNPKSGMLLERDKAGLAEWLQHLVKCRSRSHVARTHFHILTPKQSIRLLSRSFTMAKFATALVRVC